MPNSQHAACRARQLLKAFNGGIGAYQDSRGNMHVRAEVAQFIEQRDGVGPSDANVSSCRAARGMKYHPVWEVDACH
jgi:aspartate/methionine/tyrosine aminotransferase